MASGQQIQISISIGPAVHAHAPYGWLSNLTPCAMPSHGRAALDRAMCNAAAAMEARQQQQAPPLSNGASQ
jgi:uncharacterized protein YegL